ncbi:hypothetical protein ACHAWF_008517 [Thalassiosira exigua]
MDAVAGGTREPIDPTQNSAEPIETIPSSLVIVGAGMAAVKLAHYILQTSPSTSITILEANSYVGGRMKNMQFEGHTVECGANWISGLVGTYDNPVWKLAKQVELKGYKSERDDAESLFAANEDGDDVTRDYLAAVEKFNAAYERAVELAAERKLNPRCDVDVESILAECGWEVTTSFERAAEFNTLEVWVADGLDDLSAAHDLKPNANDVDLGREEVFVEDPRGFNCILDDMVRDIEEWGGKIVLNATVKAVQYLPSNVEVAAIDGDSGEEAAYRADMVASTVSLGVPQSDAIRFVPPLPKWKVDAFDEIRTFHFAKVFARFETKPVDKDQIVFVREGEPAGHYPLWTLYCGAPAGLHLYMCYLGGAEARRVEALTEERIKDEIEALFGDAFGGGACDAGGGRDAFRPTSVAVTDWSRNPRFRGSYSSFPRSAFATVAESDLTRGLTGSDADLVGVDGGRATLHFAGEAFDDLYNGWVQGAYRSGERLAKVICAGD